MTPRVTKKQALKDVLNSHYNDTHYYVN